MRRVCLATLCIGLVLPGLAQAETPSLNEIRVAMDKAWADVNSLSGDVTMDFLFPVGNTPLPVQGVGTFNYLREDGLDKSRQQITARIPEPFSMEMKIDILFDGKKMYTNMEIMGQKQSQVGEPSLEQGALPPGGSRLIAALEAELNLTSLPMETLDGSEVYVVEGIPKDGTTPFKKILIYIDREMAAQRKTEIYHLDGTVGITILFSNLKKNTSPDPSLFVPVK